MDQELAPEQLVQATGSGGPRCFIARSALRAPAVAVVLQLQRQRTGSSTFCVENGDYTVNGGGWPRQTSTGLRYATVPPVMPATARLGDASAWRSCGKTGLSTRSRDTAAARLAAVGAGVVQSSPRIVEVKRRAVVALTKTVVQMYNVLF